MLKVASGAIGALFLDLKRLEQILDKVLPLLRVHRGEVQ
jgi:hypothetical protein